MNNNESGTPLARSQHAFVYIVRQQYRQLSSFSREKRQHVRKVSFAELVQCACFPLLEKSRKIISEVQADAGLYAQYEWILHKMSFALSLEQVAASTDSQVMSRTTNEFELQVKTDRSNNNQAHLVLRLKQENLASSAYAKGVFLHCLAGGELTVIHFENVIEGQAQTIVELTSSAYKLVTCPNSKLYLC